MKCTPKVGQIKFNFRRCIFHVQIPREFKLKIVKEHKETHISAKSLQRKYGVHHSQIEQWIAQFELTGTEGLLLNSGTEESQQITK